MTLSAKYKAFLASPSSGALADNASLHYITTLTTINDAPAIIKHLAVQEKLLKKKEQKVLSAIESVNGLCVDVETTIEFLAGGGAYLPGLDDNFVADRIVNLPLVHIVHFDSQQKISQIRQYWDQGALLKQIEVIGARARNWPIRDGKDQIRLIASSASHTTQPESAASSRPSTAAPGSDDVSVTDRPIGSRRSTNNAMNDPHASLSLFEPRRVDEEGEFEAHPIASRAQSAKPPPRELSELFVGGEASTPTPKNGPGIPVKAGGGKNFKPNRLFDETDEEPVPTPMSVKTNAKKYDHFEFGEGEDTPKARETSRPTNKKHQSQWDFEDFVTPEKTKPKVLGQNVRHFGWSDDEDEHSPVRREVVHKPRRDADTHFEFKDDGSSEGREKPFTSKGRQHNNGLGLYKDHVLGGDSSSEFDTPKGDSKGPLNDVTHIKNDIRQKDFGAHWEMKDDSPGFNKAAESKKLTQNQQKVLKTMDANWGNYEPSPEQQKIRIAGNGMGGRKTTASWSLYEEEADTSKKENTGIKSMGNGMGGRKGSEFNWDF
ncbi:hypothetical protein N0V90_011983 [Kalmusia sp. IMI 367209]|nr:hypothetical protein N0V90_011983 [Kalmusia sp. IMI 367209]